MKTKNLIISTLSICLLTTLTNCTEKHSDNKAINHNELRKPEKSDYLAVETDYIETEEFPAFPGGEFNLLEFIDKNINKEIVDNLKLKEGKVVANFQIDTTGQVINLKIIRSYNQTVDSEFIRVLRLMPSWKSGKRLINNTWIKSSFDYRIPLKIPYNKQNDK